MTLRRCRGAAEDRSRGKAPSGSSGWSRSRSRSSARCRSSRSAPSSSPSATGASSPPPAPPGVNALHNFIIYPDRLRRDRRASCSAATSSASNSTALIFLGIAARGDRDRSGACARASAACRRSRSSTAPRCTACRWRPLAAPVVRLLEAAPSRQGTVGQDGFAAIRLRRQARARAPLRRGLPAASRRATATCSSSSFRARCRAPGSGKSWGSATRCPTTTTTSPLQNGSFVVKGKVTDPNVRKCAAVSSAFPPDFTTTRSSCPSRVAGFRHRFVGQEPRGRAAEARSDARRRFSGSAITFRRERAVGGRRAARSSTEPGGPSDLALPRGAAGARSAPA